MAKWRKDLAAYIIRKDSFHIYSYNCNLWLMNNVYNVIPLNSLWKFLHSFVEAKYSVCLFRMTAFLVMDLIITNADWICMIINRNKSHIVHSVHVGDPGIPDYYAVLVKLRLRKRSIPRTWQLICKKTHLLSGTA